jgi:galactonate dehydratase
MYNLIGGRCYDSLRCYANGWYRSTRIPEGRHEKAREVIRRGYTSLKFDPFGAA